MKYRVYDFWSPLCPPCRAFAPTFDQWAKKYADLAEFVKVNIFDDEGQKLAIALKIKTVPTVIVTKDDEIVARWTGGPKEVDLLKTLEV